MFLAVTLVGRQNGLWNGDSQEHLSSAMNTVIRI